MQRLWARPFEGFIVGLLMIVGFSQGFLSLGFPPEMTQVLPSWPLRAYGVYVLVGSGVWLAGIVGNRLLWERAALTGLAAALLVIALGEVWVTEVTDFPGLRPLGLMETVVWQIGLGVAAICRATYISSLVRSARESGL